ncbi:hypothetical protein MRX96_006279 [Rhipicephalus microplus]
MDSTPRTPETRSFRRRKLAGAKDLPRNPSEQRAEGRAVQRSQTPAPIHTRRLWCRSFKEPDSRVRRRRPTIAKCHDRNQAVKKASDGARLSSAKRDTDSNVVRAASVSGAPRGIRTDEKEPVAFDPSHPEDDVSRDQKHPCEATKADDQGPSVVDSVIEKDGDAQQSGGVADGGMAPSSASSEAGEREPDTRSSAKLPPKPPPKSHRLVLFRPLIRESFFVQVAPAKKLRPSGIIIVLLYVGIVIILVVVTIALFTKSSAHQATECTTNECREYETLLASSVDASVSPCNSFARFVCGRWERSHVLSVREFLYERALERMTSQIRNVEVLDSGQNAVQRAAAAFRSCEDVLHGRVDHLATVKRTLRDVGISWPRDSAPG